MLTALVVVAVLSFTACADPVSNDETASNVGRPKVHPATAVTKLVPANLKKNGRIVFATNSPYAPLQYFASDNRTLIGYDIDLGNAIAAAMGLRAEWKNVSSDALVPGLQAHRYDLALSGFSVTHERLQSVDFVSYYLSGGGFLIKRGSGYRVGGYDDLCGLRVGVIKGVSQVGSLEDASDRCASRGRRPVEIMQLPDQNVVSLNLVSGRSQVAVADKPQVEYAAGRSHDLCVVSTYQTSHSIAGMALPKGEPQMARALQGAMNDLLRSGAYAQISKRWDVGVPVGNVRLSGAYRSLAASWGVGARGQLVRSQIFSKPSSISDDDKYFYQPIRPGCA